jgi:S-adenosylmethionine:diacylglycerol 3-amino-3-carboxypropyl transferase
MEHKELLKTCDFCDEALKDPWFSLKVFRWVGWNTSRCFALQMCNRCYPKIHQSIRTGTFELTKQCFQEAVAKIKQNWHKAVEI